ncbi:MAG: 50S ribosomal protein L17 [Elusimicrobiota bacterium]
MAGTHAGRKKLQRTSSHRKALYRNMSCSLLKYEQITTTEAKAKMLRSFVEKIISVAKNNDLQSKRIVREDINDKEVFQKIFNVLVPRYAERKGGYLRIIKLSHRISDNAPMCVVKLIV